MTTPTGKPHNQTAAIVAALLLVPMIGITLIAMASFGHGGLAAAVSAGFLCALFLRAIR